MFGSNEEIPSLNATFNPARLNNNSLIVHTETCHMPDEESKKYCAQILAAFFTVYLYIYNYYCLYYMNSDSI